MFTEFSDKKHLSSKGLEPATSCVMFKDATTSNSCFSYLSDSLNLVKSRKTLVKHLAALKTLVIYFGQLHYSSFHGKAKIYFNLLQAWAQNVDFGWNKSSWVND